MNTMDIFTVKDAELVTSDGEVFVPSHTIGRGRYGTCFEYVSPLRSICVKRIPTDRAAGELEAIEILSKVSPNARRGCVAASVAGTERGFVYIAMPMMSGDIGKLDLPVAPTAALRIVMRLSAILERLWINGLAYCDLKCTNVLLGPENSAVFGDLGSIVPTDGSTGLFSFPPRRSMNCNKDGVCVPRESDLVWGVTMILSSLLLGMRWTSDRFGAQSIRSRAGTNSLSVAFDRVSRELKAEASLLPPSCETVILYGIAAWEEGDRGKKHTLRGFRHLIDAPLSLKRSAYLAGIQWPLKVS